MLSQLGAKIAKTLGEEDLGIPLNSYFEAILASYGRQHMISDLLLYDGYDEQTQIFHNQDSIGFVLETLPLIGASEEMQKEVSSLFQYILPEGSSLQVILWADPHIGDLCDSWKQARLGQAHMGQARGFVRQSTSIPLIRRNYPALTQTHLPNEFHLLMMLPTMMPSRFWDSIR